MTLRSDSFDRASGERDLAEAIRNLREAGAPAHWFKDVELAGPFATFDGAARWVECPYRDGVVLIGAAGATGPTWGEGLARTLRDVRLLRDHLVANDDWDSAGRAFADDHDVFFDRMLRLGAMRGELLFAVGPEADERRKRAFAAQRSDPSILLDTLGLGPDAACDDLARARYFGEAYSLLWYFALHGGLAVWRLRTEVQRGANGCIGSDSANQADFRLVSSNSDRGLLL